MDKPVLDTYQKALAFNMDKGIYGTIAEIGAGQETVRWFFKVGGAAGSIAKAMSAYDMNFSDSIYGSCKRYVSRERLHLNARFLPLPIPSPLSIMPSNRQGMAG